MKDKGRDRHNQKEQRQIESNKYNQRQTGTPTYRNIKRK